MVATTLSCLTIHSCTRQEQRHGILSAEHWVRFFPGATQWKSVLWLPVHKHKTVVYVYWYMFILIYWLPFSGVCMQGAFQTETSMFLVRRGRLKIVTNAGVSWLRWFAAACKFPQIIVCLFRNWLKCSDLKKLIESVHWSFILAWATFLFLFPSYL